jgi:leucyl/phenylalanyl-tRNA--protein transferase
MSRKPESITWLAAGESFPPASSAWGADTPAPGLLAAGGQLDVATLIQAYSQGIFPWFSPGQPTLWWSPEPRMVLNTRDFRLHRSLKKTIRCFAQSDSTRLSFDQAFGQVIRACAQKPRDGQNGTWIVPEMIGAYETLHLAGHAHSVETWVDGKLAGGLYCVNLGGMVFGESMFAHQSDASKIALAGLVAFCRASGIDMIDCQQNTAHLASLGAAQMPRPEFMSRVKQRLTIQAPIWQFDPLHWHQILTVQP